MKIKTNSIFKFGIVLSIFLFVSCSPSKKKTFLDFELGMTYKEYIAHANNLYKSGHITKLNGKDFHYTIKLNDDNYVFFKVHAYVYGNSRLSMLQAESIYNLSDDEKNQLYNIFVKNKGTTSQPYFENSANNWIAVWGDKDLWGDEVIDERLVFIREDSGWRSTLVFMATGGLSDNIDKLDKKENGYIDIENKF